MTKAALATSGELKSICPNPIEFPSWSFATLTPAIYPYFANAFYRVYSSVVKLRFPINKVQLSVFPL